MLAFVKSATFLNNNRNFKSYIYVLPSVYSQIWDLNVNGPTILFSSEFSFFFGRNANFLCSTPASYGEREA